MFTALGSQFKSAIARQVQISTNKWQELTSQNNNNKKKDFLTIMIEIYLWSFGVDFKTKNKNAEKVKKISDCAFLFFFFLQRQRRATEWMNEADDQWTSKKQKKTENKYFTRTEILEMKQSSLFFFFCILSSNAWLV